jgi:hypothetical protein
MPKCPYCHNNYSLNVVSSNRGKFKYIKTGCCDAGVRSCPDPAELLKFPISQDEKRFLEHLAPLHWFDKQQLKRLLEIEAAVSDRAQVGEVAA